MAAPYKGPLDYIDVASRIIEFREKYPTGTLGQISLEFVREFAGKDWVVYTAGAWRTPDDERPGVGTAWEPVPGATNFTRDSEVQNAETAAWGRAMVAALAVDTKKGIASSEEVRNRQPEPEKRTGQTEEQASALTVQSGKAPAAWRADIAMAETVQRLTEIHERAKAGLWATPDVMHALTERKKVIAGSAS